MSIPFTLGFLKKHIVEKVKIVLKPKIAVIFALILAARIVFYVSKINIDVKTTPTTERTPGVTSQAKIMYHPDFVPFRLSKILAYVVPSRRV